MGDGTRNSTACDGRTFGKAPAHSLRGSFTFQLPNSPSALLTDPQNCRARIHVDSYGKCLRIAFPEMSGMSGCMATRLTSSICRQPPNVHRALSTITCTPLIAHHPSLRSHRLQSTGYRPPATVHRLPTTGYRPPATVQSPRPPATIQSPPFSIQLPPSTAHCPLSTAQRRTYSIQRSTSDLQRPTSNIRHPPTTAASMT